MSTQQNKSDGFVYLASPYSHPFKSVREARVAAVQQKAVQLMEEGYNVFCPIAHTYPLEGLVKVDKHDFWMKQDIAILQYAQKLFVLCLPGWLSSSGVTEEIKYARDHGIPVAYLAVAEYYADFPVGEPKESILQEAENLIHGDRRGDYGHPLDDFTRTAKMWAAILGLTTVTPEEVGLCMIALKISRECNKPKRDNLVDVCGYAGTIEMVLDEKERRSKL